MLSLGSKFINFFNSSIFSISFSYFLIILLLLISNKSFNPNLNSSIKGKDKWNLFSKLLLIEIILKFLFVKKLIWLLFSFILIIEIIIIFLFNPIWKVELLMQSIIFFLLLKIWTFFSFNKKFFFIIKYWFIALLWGIIKSFINKTFKSWLIISFFNNCNFLINVSDIYEIRIPFLYFNNKKYLLLLLIKYWL